MTSTVTVAKLLKDRHLATQLVSIFISYTTKSYQPSLPVFVYHFLFCCVQDDR